MSFVKKGASAFGKLIIVAVLAGTFLIGLISVVYLSLQGKEIKVPDIVGKDFTASEDELTSLGLRIKKRADRYSSEKPNTVLEQLPKAGETVKTGQMILVVRSKANPEGEEAPATIKKNDDEDDSSKIEELISDKPKKTNKANTNSNSNKKKISTTRDVINSNSDNSNSTSTDGDNSNKKDSAANVNSSKSNKNSSTGSDNKSTTKESDSRKDGDSKKNNETKKNTETDKTKLGKTTNNGDLRPRKTPSP